MDKNNKKKVLILSIIGLIGLIIVTIGITYAVFTYTKLGTTDNTVTSGTLKFLYTENTGVKTGIKLTNALPISDTQGKALDGDNNVFDFSIEATNTGTETIPYEVTLRKKDTSTLVRISSPTVTLCISVLLLNSCSSSDITLAFEYTVTIAVNSLP